MKSKTLYVWASAIVLCMCIFALASCGENEPSHAHNYAILKYDNENHWYECACGDKSGIEVHNGGNSTCIELPTCSVCAVKYGEYAAHPYESKWIYNDTHHWHESICDCEVKVDFEEHALEDSGRCKVCQYEILREPKTQVKSYYDFFDSVSSIYSFKGDSVEEFTKNYTDVADLLGKYHKLFDIYYEYSGVNNIKTINENAGKSPVKVDPLLIEFLVYAKEMYTLTNGKTNIAMGSVRALWRECREDAASDPDNARIPDVSALAEAALHCDINNLIVDEDACTVYISDPNMRLDAETIGMGYATEKAAQLLIDRGVSSYVLNIGGNIRCIGEKVTGEAWTMGITNPDRDSSETLACRVKVSDTSIATLGDYERFYYVNNQKYHYVIDPVTLMPTDYFPSVSVLTEDSGLASALSMALFCMSYEDGITLIESIGGVDVIWILYDGTIKYTDGVQFLVP